MEMFVQVVLPVIMIFAIGYVVQKWKRVNIKAVSTVAIYILTPCLVFKTFYQTPIDLQYGYMVLFAVLLLFSIVVLNKIYAYMMKYSQAMQSALILSTAFMNSGNYGAPIILFAYGETGFAYAVLFMVLQAIIMNVFGVYYAARGKAGAKMAITSVLKMPATYAVVIALGLQYSKFSIPQQFEGTIDLLAQATIPMMMLILGMQLAEIKLQDLQFREISYGIIMRMFISPALAFLIVSYLPLDPVLQKVLIVSAAMPAAATTTMYAVQFDNHPELVSSITLFTTIFSIFSLSLILILLG